MRALTPRSLEWTDTAPVRASASRRILAEPDAVWAVIADHPGWTEWFQQISRVEPGTPAEGIGGTRTVQTGPVTVEEEFLAWDPGRRFAFTVTHSSKPGIHSMNEDIRLTPDGAGATTVTYTMALEPVGARFLRPVLEPVLRRTLRGALAGLAKRVEA